MLAVESSRKVFDFLVLLQRQVPTILREHLVLDVLQVRSLTASFDVPAVLLILQIFCDGLGSKCSALENCDLIIIAGVFCAQDNFGNRSFATDVLCDAAIRSN